MTLGWRPVDGGMGDIAARDGTVLARYDHSGRKNHPFFADVRPLAHGGVLTNHAPWDHRWHHGLWWSWKFIDDVLYWEDHEGYGGNRVGLGRSLVIEHHAEQTDSVVRLRERVEWREDGSGAVVLTEERALEISSDPEHGVWWIDWDLSWRPQRDVFFDVTPFPEKPWGGYAGLNYRAARSMVADEQILASGGLAGAEAIHGTDVDWVALSGNVDGSGADEPDRPAYGGVLLVAHPDNPWGRSGYVFSGATGEFGFAAMAPLMHGGQKLAVTETLRLRYRTVIYGERLTSDRLGALAEDYRRD
ncbi:DUF6807 family protein [Microbacterium sp. I2]|uniref:DUF6807 family protein n=1 Tax=Microbacterium sp. I2 TaxID=3391826 RepID=UPI003EDA44E2